MTEQGRSDISRPGAGDIRTSAPGSRTSVPGRPSPAGELGAGLKAGPRIYLLAVLASALPLGVFLLSLYSLRLSAAASAAAAALAAAAAAFALGRIISLGLVRPFLNLSSSVKDFIAAGYSLKAPVPKEGWPEARGMISSLNRMMLELGAYHGFRLDQVIQERAKAEAMMETIADGVMLVDDAGRIVCSNRKAQRLLGIERNSSGVLPGAETNTAFSRALAEVLAPGGKHRHAEAEAPVPGGPAEALSCFQVVSAKFMLATMKQPGHVVVIRDVTAEKKIEETKETFFQMITHDMRAPLSSVQGYAQLIMSTMQLPAGAEKHLQTIVRASKRLGGMVEDILNTNKLERGAMTLQAAAVDACALTARVHENLAPDAARKNISLTLERSAEKIELSADAALLERVITNLAANSLKFTPEGGRITLACGEAEGWVFFSVEDTGPGIPEDKRGMIFEKYSQMEEHRSLGFGLGLAMCKMAVELHKGRIWVESEVGKGSKFNFSIPRGLEPAAAQPRPVEQGTVS